MSNCLYSCAICGVSCELELNHKYMHIAPFHLLGCMVGYSLSFAYVGNSRLWRMK